MTIMARMQVAFFCYGLVCMGFFTMGIMGLLHRLASKPLLLVLVVAGSMGSVVQVYYAVQKYKKDYVLKKRAPSSTTPTDATAA